MKTLRRLPFTPCPAASSRALSSAEHRNTIAQSSLGGLGSCWRRPLTLSRIMRRAARIRLRTCRNPQSGDRHSSRCLYTHTKGASRTGILKRPRTQPNTRENEPELTHETRLKERSCREMQDHTTITREERRDRTLYIPRESPGLCACVRAR